MVAANNHSYESVLRDVLENGTQRQDRTGEGTISSFSKIIRYDLRESFPLITSKFVPMRLISSELRWFLQGQTNVRKLQEDNNHIWDEWRAPYDNSERRILNKEEFYELYGNKIDSFIKDKEVYLSSSHDDEEKENIREVVSHTEYTTPERNLWKKIITSDEKVHPHWYSFEKFCHDLHAIPHYDYWEMNPHSFVLTHDYFINNDIIDGWHPSTVVFTRKDRYDYPTNNEGEFLRRELIADGYMGPIYGYQWRSWNGAVDQIHAVVEQLKNDPTSRRMIVSAWNADKIQDMALPPCHVMFQLYVSDNKLSMQVYQRSADMFLGVPFNIASYALLTHILAQHVGLDVGELTWIGGDCHIYLNHRDQVKEQLYNYDHDHRKLPDIKVEVGQEKLSDIEDFQATIIGYHPHKRLHGKVAV